MKKDTILICLEKFNIGGVETFVLNQAIELKNIGFNVIIISEAGVYVEQAKEYGIKWIDFSFAEDIQLNAQKTEQLIKIIEENNVTQVFINQFPCIFSMFEACVITNTPYVMYLHMSTSLLENDNIFDWFEAKFPIFKELLIETLNKAHKVIAIVDGIKYYVSERYNIDENKILVRKNGLSFDYYKSTNKKIEKDKLIFVSRIDRQKYKHATIAVDFYFEYLKTNPNASLKIVGDGPNIEQLKEYVNLKTVEYEKETETETETETGTEEKDNNKIKTNIEFLYSRTDIVDLVNESDILLGMGRTVIEALVLKKIVVLLGYNNNKGIINRKNVELASTGNFSGVNLENVTIEETIKNLDKLTKEEYKKITEEIFKYMEETVNLKETIYYIKTDEIENNENKKYNKNQNNNNNNKYSNELFLLKNLNKFYNKYLIDNNRAESAEKYINILEKEKSEFHEKYRELELKKGSIIKLILVKTKRKVVKIVKKIVKPK